MSTRAPRNDPSQGLVDELPEVFARFGRVVAKRMFGGFGLYHDDRMFGLVTGGRLYLKTDEENRPAFDAKRLASFEYMRQGKMTPTSYLEAPPEIYEDRDEAAQWARLAWEAVLRGPVARKKAAAKRTAGNKPAAPKPRRKASSTAKPAATKRTPAKR